MPTNASIRTYRTHAGNDPLKSSWTNPATLFLIHIWLYVGVCSSALWLHLSHSIQSGYIYSTIPSKLSSFITSLPVLIPILQHPCLASIHQCWHYHFIISCTVILGSMFPETIFPKPPSMLPPCQSFSPIHSPFLHSHISSSLGIPSALLALTVLYLPHFTLSRFLACLSFPVYFEIY